MLIETTGVWANVLKTGCNSGKSSRPCSVVTNGVFCRENRLNDQ